MYHSLGLCTVLLGSFLQGDGLFLNYRGFLGSCIFCNNHRSNVFLFGNSCHRLRLRCLDRFRCLGNNLHTCHFCGLLGLLRVFHKAAVFLHIDSLGVQLLCPLGRIIPGVDLFGVQLIGNPLGILACAKYSLFLPGELLFGCLLCQDIRNLHHIAGLSQLRETVRCCLTDGIHILCQVLLLVGLDQTVQLRAGEGTAQCQFLLILHSQLMAQCALGTFQSRLHQLRGKSAILGFVLLVLGNGLIHGLRACMDTTGNEAAQHIKGHILRHIQPGLLLRFFLTPTILPVSLNNQIEIALIPQGQLIRKIVENGRNTFFQAFGCRLLGNIGHKLPHGCRRAHLHQVIHADIFSQSLCYTIHGTVGNRLVTGCTAADCIIHTGSSCRAEELDQCLPGATSDCRQRALGNAGAQAIHIAKALASDNRDLLIQGSVFFVQVLGNAACNSLGILKGRDFPVRLGHIPNCALGNQITQIVSHAQGCRSQCAKGIHGSCQETIICLALDFLNLIVLCLLVQHTVDAESILIGLLSFGIPQVAKVFPMFVGPSFRGGAHVRILLLGLFRHGNHLAAADAGKGSITSNIPNVPQKLLPPLRIFLGAHSFLVHSGISFLLLRIGFPARFRSLFIITGNGRPGLFQIAPVVKRRFASGAAVILGSRGRSGRNREFLLLVLLFLFVAPLVK